jgi:hypothetical protein
MLLAVGWPAVQPMEIPSPTADDTVVVAAAVFASVVVETAETLLHQRCCVMIPQRSCPWRRQ